MADSIDLTWDAANGCEAMGTCCEYCGLAPELVLSDVGGLNRMAFKNFIIFFALAVLLGTATSFVYSQAQDSQFNFQDESWHLVSPSFNAQIDKTAFGFAAGKYSLENEMNVGEGYWVYGNEAVVLTEDVQKDVSYIKSVDTGWYLMGNPFNRNLDYAELYFNNLPLTESGLPLGGFIAFGNYGYNIVQELTPNEGAWLKTNASGTLRIKTNDRIYFSSDRDSVFSENPLEEDIVTKVYSMLSDGTAVIKELDYSSGIASVTTDGTMFLAFVNAELSNCKGLCAYSSKADGDRVGIDGYIQGGRLSYDSKYYVYIGRAQDCLDAGFAPPICNDIFIYNMETAEIVRITENKYREGNPSFSPDGNGIVFDSYRDTDASEIDLLTKSNVYIMDLESKNVTQLTDDGLSFCPSFSPDEKHIIFLSEVSPGAGNHIFQMSLDKMNIIDLTPELGGGLSEPSYSPDGQWIVFSDYIDDYYQSELFVMRADGSMVTRLTNERGLDRYARWGP